MKRIRFIHCARTDKDILFKDEVAQAAVELGSAVTVDYVIDDSNTAYTEGPLSKSVLKEYLPKTKDTRIMLCGPAPMMSSVRRSLQRLRFNLNQLSCEEFKVETEAVPVGKYELQFAQSGGRVKGKTGGDKAGTLLDIAEEQGLQPKSGCRMGICYTCKCQKLSGRVYDLQTGMVGDDGAEEIRLCMSVPQGNVEIDL